MFEICTTLSHSDKDLTQRLLRQKRWQAKQIDRVCIDDPHSCQSCNFTTAEAIRCQVLWNYFGPCNSMVTGRSDPCEYSSMSPKLCECSNSTATGPIRSITSSMEPSWSVEAQRLSHWPVEPVRAFPSGTKLLVDVVTSQPLNRFALS